MNPSPFSRRDLEHAIHYTRLPGLPDQADSLQDHRRIFRRPAGICLSMMLVSSMVLLIFSRDQSRVPAKVNVYSPRSWPGKFMPPSRGIPQGVSEKTFRDFAADGPDYPWTNAMLTWQRTAYHFQPEKNWMNDLSGPLFYKGWYHLFYQYNPDSAVWGNISWGHAISEDLIHWLYLPYAMVPDHWYDINGVWTGSATLLGDGHIVMLYTGVTDRAVQVQNLAYPANLSDPLLLHWVKYENNPVIIPPAGINISEYFRDPTTAWLPEDGKWRVAVGSKINETGVTLVYQTTNFTTYELLEGVMHAVPGTGMWECVDFYPISTIGSNGLDTSYDGTGIKHVLKASSSNDVKDYYAMGTYDPRSDNWTPDNPELDVGMGLRVDYGKYYASKTFYDQNKQRRVLLGWIGETDSEDADLLKGWASIQSIPRTVEYDNETGTNIIQWPVQEVERLRLNSTEFHRLELEPGTVVPLNISSATQLDITATFEVEREVTLEVEADDVGYNCSTSGAVLRGALGPFGLLVIADAALTELTPVYFYVAKEIDGSYNTFFCSDEMRSSMAADVNKKVYGGMVPVIDGEKLSMRLLVDHSIVESFAQGGRTVVTSRIYPTKAIYGAAQVFLFNNATGVKVTASVKIWEMDSAHIHHFPLDRM